MKNLELKMSNLGEERTKLDFENKELQQDIIDMEYDNEEESQSML